MNQEINNMKIQFEANQHKLLNIISNTISGELSDRIQSQVINAPSNKKYTKTHVEMTVNLIPSAQISDDFKDKVDGFMQSIANPHTLLELLKSRANT